MQFVSDVKYPKDFPAVLMDLCREILRAQPDNIYQFAVDYFTELKQAIAQGE